jgi:hypothetical protein
MSGWCLKSHVSISCIIYRVQLPCYHWLSRESIYINNILQYYMLFHFIAFQYTFFNLLNNTWIYFLHTFSFVHNSLTNKLYASIASFLFCSCIKLHTWFCLSYFLKTNITLYFIYQYFMSINSFFNTVSDSRYSRPITVTRDPL